MGRLCFGYIDTKKAQLVELHFFLLDLPVNQTGICDGRPFKNLGFVLLSFAYPSLYRLFQLDKSALDQSSITLLYG